MDTIHKFKRMLQKLSLEIYKKTDVKRVVRTDNANEFLLICKKAIEKPDSELIVSPLTTKMYVKNDKLGIMIIMQHKVIQVINHIYSYNMVVDEYTWSNIVDIFNNEKERRCIELEKKAKSNIKHSLKSIITNLS
jgi:hypothetical protein